MRAGLQATVAAVKVVSHLFADIIGQFVAVLYCEIGKAFAGIESVARECTGGAVLETSATVSAMVGGEGGVVFEFGVNK